MGDTIPVSSTLTASLAGGSQSRPRGRVPQQPPPNDGLGNEDSGHERDEVAETEALLQTAVTQAGFSGTEALKRVSQILDLLKKAPDATQSSAGGGSSHSDAAGGGRETSRDPPSRPGVPTLTVSLIAGNSFAALSEGGTIVPDALIKALNNDEFLPLSCFLSTELATRNMTNVQYSYKTSATHTLQILDVSAYLARDFLLSRDQFLDGHRNLLRAYQLSCYGDDVVQDLANYVEGLRSNEHFYIDRDWRAFLRLDREVRMAWYNAEHGRFPLCNRDTFNRLQYLILDLRLDANDALHQQQHQVQRVDARRSPPPLRRQRSRSRSPQVESPRRFREGSGSYPRRSCCMLCGKTGHSGRNCSQQDAKCELRGDRLTAKSSGDRVCFDFNAPRGCKIQGAQHTRHQCSVCLGKGHSAQECAPNSGERRH